MIDGWTFNPCSQRVTMPLGKFGVRCILLIIKPWRRGLGRQINVGIIRPLMSRCQHWRRHLLPVTLWSGALHFMRDESHVSLSVNLSDVNNNAYKKYIIMRHIFCISAINYLPASQNDFCSLPADGCLNMDSYYFFSAAFLFAVLKACNLQSVRSAL